MKQEDFRLTQRRPTTYAKSMVDTAEKAVERDTEKDANKHQDEAPKVRSTEDWVKKVKKAITEAQQRQQEAMSNAGKNLASSGTLDRQQIRQFIQQLDPKEVERLLQELRDLKQEVKNSAGKEKEAEEVVLYERQLAAVAAEKEEQQKTTETETAKPGETLEEQVFDDFAKFLRKDAKVDYGGDKLVVRRTADGVLHVTIPKPTLENMLQLAKDLKPEDFHKETGTPQDFANQLMTAALIMDQQAIFSAKAIGDLYNTGLRLQKILAKAESTYEPKTFEEIQEASRTLFKITNPAEREELQKIINNTYLHVFMGKHEVKFVQEGNRLHIQREGRGTLYDSLFDRFSRWLETDTPPASANEKEKEKWKTTKEERDKWLRENGYTVQELRNITNRDKIIQAYEKWLCDPQRQYNMLHRMKNFVEEKVTKDRVAERAYRAVFRRWESILLNTEMGEDLKNEIAQELRSHGNVADQLTAINSLFQPNGEIAPKALKYLPKELVAIFQKGDSQQRNEAACVLASAYVKQQLLEQQGFTVLTEMEGSHTRLIVIKGDRVFRMDPNTPKKVEGKQLTGVEEIQGEFRKKILEKAASGDVLIFELDEYGESKATISSGDDALVSGFLSNMAGLEFDNPMLSEWRDLSREERFAAARQAVRLCPDNAMAWALLSRYAPEGSTHKSEYWAQAVRIDPHIQEKIDKGGYLIGAWNLTLPGGVAIAPGSPYADILLRATNQLEVIDRSKGVPPGPIQAQLRDLDPNFLGLLQNMLRQIDPVNFNADISQAMTKDITDALNDIQSRSSESPLFQLNPSDKYRIENEGPMKWFEDFYLTFASRWKPGLAPENESYTEFKKKVGDAMTFIEGLKQVNPTGLAAKEYESFVELQGKIVGALIGATQILQGPKQYEGAMQSIQSLGFSGIHLIRGLDEGRVGFMASQYLQQLETQRIADGGYLKTENFAKVKADVVARATLQAQNNIGIYADRLKEFLVKAIGSRIPTATLDLPALLAAALPKEKTIADKDLAHLLNAHFNMARWTAICDLSEGAIASNGLPPDGHHHGFPGQDLSGREYPWLHGLQTMFRFDLLTLGRRELFWGQHGEIGPWRRHIVEEALKNIGLKEFDPKKMSEEEFHRAADAIFQFEFYNRSDRFYDSTWRMGKDDGYLKYMPALLREKGMSKEAIDDFALFLQLRTTATFGAGQADKNKERLDVRKNLWTGKIAQFEPEKALEQVAAIHPGNKEFQKFLTDPTTRETEFLRNLIARLHGKSVDRAGYLTALGDEKITPGTPEEARYVFNFFMNNFADFMHRFRVAGYTHEDGGKPRPYQRDFGRGIAAGNSTDPWPAGHIVGLFHNEAQEMNEYFHALGFAGDVAPAFQQMMAAMTGTVRDSIGESLATDPRYLGIYYRTISTEDALFEIKESREKFLEWLASDTTNNDISRLVNDLNTLTQGVQAVVELLTKGDFNHPDKIFEAVHKAAGAVAGVRGAKGGAKVIQDFGAFYLKAIRLKGAFNFLGIDPRLSIASEAKKYFGAHIVGKTDEELLAMYEKALLELAEGTDMSEEDAKLYDREIRKYLHIRKRDIGMTIFEKILLLLFIEVLKGLVGEGIGPGLKG